MDYFMKKKRADQVLLAKVYSKERDGVFDWGHNSNRGSKLYRELTKRLNEYVPYHADLPCFRVMWVGSDLYVVQFRVKKGSKNYRFLIKEGFEEGD